MQPLLALIAAAGVVGYPFLEARWFRVKHLRVPFDRDVPSLTVLHVSDTHLDAGNTALRRFLQTLPGRIPTPDLVLATGDLIDDNTGIEPITAALNALDARLGKFYVLGSHDYFQTRFQNYLRYFGDSSHRDGAQKADTAALEDKLQRAGWISVANRTEHVTAPWGTVRISGVDDPYLKRHKTHHIERSTDDAFALGLAHAPDVVSEWALNGYDLVLSGHTHAGQVRLPGVGALVTNSSLPAALAGGLHRIGNAWLHVSPGLGTSKFAPVRLNCRPEVTLLHITKQSE